MKLLTIIFLSLTFCQMAFAFSMKLEGSCTGKLVNSTPVSFSYYSTFNGCKKVSRAAISFTSGMEGLLTGKRRLSNGFDHYSFKARENIKIKELAHLTFKDSTGNTSGKFYYIDEQEKGQSIEVQCEIRDYEYEEC